MTSASGPRKSSPRLWPSLLIAAPLSILLSYKWLTRAPYEWFDLRLLAAPVHIPLTFGIIWPALIGLQAVVFPSHRRAKLRRYPVAGLLFVLSCVGWIPFAGAEIERGQRIQANAAHEQTLQENRTDAQQAAFQAIGDHGILAFTEPLQMDVALVLQDFIYSSQLTLEDLLAASEHYESPMILEALAQKPNCPPEALEILYAKAAKQLHNYPDESTVGLVFDKIEKNPNVPVDVLVKMVESDSPLARMSAVKNPKLPHSTRMAYLKRGCGFEWPSELRVVAADPDTPVDVLVCLSTNSAAALDVGRNPHTPTSVVETMSESSDYWTRTAGKEGLAKRQASPQ